MADGLSVMSRSSDTPPEFELSHVDLLAGKRIMTLSMVLGSLAKLYAKKPSVLQLDAD